MRRFFSIFLRIGITALLLLFLFNKVKWLELVGTLKSTNLSFLLLYTSLYLFGNILASHRWQILLIAQGINLPPIRIILSYLLFLFFNPFLPTGVGGDVARTYDLFKETKRGRQIVASVLVDRLVGFVALMLIALIALSIGSKDVNNPSLYRGMWGLFGVFLFTLLLLFWRVPLEKMVGLFKMKNIAERVKGVYDAIYLFRAKPKALIKTLFLSLLIQIGCILIFYFIACSFGSNINLKYFFLFIPLISVISMLPVSLSGLGVRDAASVFLFTKVGMTSSQAFSMSLIWFFLGVVLGLLAGLAHILIKFILRKNTLSAPPGCGKVTLVSIILTISIVKECFSAPCYGTDMPGERQWYKGVETNIILERELDKPYGEIESSQYFINLSYGLKSWLSLDGKLGLGDFTHRPDNSYRIDYAPNFAGGYGFRIRAFEQEKHNLKGVVGFQHISLHPGAENINNDKNEAILDDWQFSGLISKGFGFLTPYAGCKFSRLLLIHKVNEGTRKRRESDEPSLGIVLGADVLIRRDWKLNLEGRFIDETAFSLGLGTIF